MREAMGNLAGVVPALAVCALLFLLDLVGVEFGLERGSPMADLVHALLDWSAILPAVVCALLVLVSFIFQPSTGVLALGGVFLWVAALDAHHLEASLPAAGGGASEGLMHATWAAGRLVKAVLLPAAVILFFREGLHARAFRPLLFFQLLSGLIVLGVIAVSSGNPALFSSAFSSPSARFWELPPLVLFIAALIWAYPRLGRRTSGMLVPALMASAVFDAAGQLHMALDSTGPYDDGFNLAHVERALSWLSPLVGLFLDQGSGSLRAERSRREAEDRLKQVMRSSQETVAAVGETNDRLARKERELKAEISTLTARAESRALQGSELDPAWTGAFRKLVASAAHDMKNPLASISMGVDYLNRQLSQKDRSLVMVLEEIKRAVGKTDVVIKGLVTDLHSIAGDRKGEEPDDRGDQEEDPDRRR